MAKNMQKPTVVALVALALPLLSGWLGPIALIGGWWLARSVRRNRYGTPGLTAR